MPYGRLSFVCLFLLTLVGCNAGANSSDRTQGTATITIGSSEFSGTSDSLTSEIPLDQSIDIKFSRFLFIESVTDSNAYLKVYSSSTPSVGSVAYDKTVCDASGALSAIVSYNNQTITIAPRSALTCGSYYAICLGPKLQFDTDLFFDGRTIFFKTQDCTPVLADAPQATLLLNYAMTPITLTNSGGKPKTCSVSPSLPTGLAVGVANSSCQITGTPTVASPVLTSYTITGTNASGSDSSTIQLAVLEAVPPNASGFASGVQTQTTIPLSWTSGGGTTAGFYLVVGAGATAPPDCSAPTYTLGNVGSATASSLTAGTQYSFRLCSFNANPTPDVSSGVTLTSRWTLANNPTFGVSTKTSSSINLVWNAAAGAAGYWVKRAAGAAAPGSCATPDFQTAGTSQNFVGLSPGTQHSFRVCSANGATPTPDLSSGATITTLWTLPNEVSLGSTTVTATSIVLNWAPSTGATQYRVARAPGAAAPGACTSGDPIAVGTSYNDLSLTEGTQYSYRVCAENQNGDLTSGVTTTTYTDAGEVTLGTITSDTTNVIINWSAGNGVSGGLSGYRLQRSPVGPPAARCSSPDYTTTSLTQTYSGQTSGSQQFFRICSLNAAGTPSAGTTFSVWLKPNPAATFTMTANAPDGFTFGWTAGAGTNNGYRIKYAAGATAPTDCNLGAFTSSYAALSTSANFSGLSPGQYSFVLCTLNGNNPADIAVGPTITRWTQPAEVTSFAASGLSLTSISLNWSATPGTNSGYIITRSNDGSNPPANCATNGVTSIVQSPASGVTSWTDNPVTTGSHVYRICTINGNSPPDQSPGTLGTFWTLPPDPTLLTGSGASTSSILVSWTATASDQAGFRVSRRTDGIYPVAGCSADVVQTINSGSTTSWTDTTAPASIANYRVCAINANSIVQASSGATGQLWPIPPQPAAFMVSARAPGSITFGFSTAAGSQSGYRLARGAAGSPPANCNAFVTTFPQNASSGTDSTINGLIRGREYSYSICAMNTNPTPEQSTPATLSSVWALPGDPSVSNTYPGTGTSADISWVPDGDAVNYLVQYDTAPVPVQCPVPNTSTAGTSTTLGGLSLSTQYFVRVCAVNGNGDISSGGTDTFTTGATLMMFGSSVSSVAPTPARLKVEANDQVILEGEDQHFVFERDPKTGSLTFKRREPAPEKATNLTPAKDPSLFGVFRQKLRADETQVRLMRFEPKRNILAALKGADLEAYYWDKAAQSLTRLQLVRDGVPNPERTQSVENLKEVSDMAFSLDGKNLYLLDPKDRNILQFRIVRDPLDVLPKAR